MFRIRFGSKPPTPAPAATSTAPTGPLAPAFGPDTGIPVFPVADILRMYEADIRLLCERSGLPLEDERKYLRPMIERYAALVHMLPASKENHHARPGGLFHHGLDVACRALRRAAGAHFHVDNDTPEQREHMVYRWRVALVAAAFLHDSGKVLTDLVVLANGAAQWNPRRQSIVEWAAENRVTSYHYTFRTGRYQKHSTASTVLIDRVVGSETVAWLLDVPHSGTYCWVALQDAIADPLSQKDLEHFEDRANYTKRKPTFIDNILVRADAESTAEDKSAPPHTTVPAYHGHVPLRDALLKAIQACVGARWRVNQPGAQVYTHGNYAFLVWPVCMNGIIGELIAAKVAGLSFQQDHIAENLASAGLTESYQNGIHSSDWWTIHPEGVSGQLTALCLPVSVVFPAGRPDPYPVVVDNIDSMLPRQVDEEKDRKPEPAAAPPAPLPSRPTYSPQPPASNEPQPPNIADGFPAKTMTSPDEFSKPFDLTTPQGVIDYFNDERSYGRHIARLVRDVRLSGKDSEAKGWGHALVYLDNAVYLAYPNGSPPDMDKHEFEERLRSDGWIVYDHQKRNLLSQPIGTSGRRGLRFSEQISRLILVATGGPPENQILATSEDEKPQPAVAEQGSLLDAAAAQEDAPSGDHDKQRKGRNKSRPEQRPRDARHINDPAGTSSKSNPVLAMIQTLIAEGANKGFVLDVSDSEVRCPTAAVGWFLSRARIPRLSDYEFKRLIAESKAQMKGRDYVWSRKDWDVLTKDLTS